MPKVNVYKMDGTSAGDMELNESVFGIEPNTAVMHQVIKAQLANRRQGTQSTLTRTEVRGGGKKPWRQKGTGRARQGSSRSPQWRKGGVVFAPKPRSYRQSVNRKVRQLAMRSALSAKVMDEQIIVMDALEFNAPKTKDMIKVLEALQVSGAKTLVVMPEPDMNVEMSARNIPGVKMTLSNTLNVLDIMNHDKFIITKQAIEQVQEVYAK